MGQQFRLEVYIPNQSKKPTLLLAFWINKLKLLFLLTEPKNKNKYINK